MADFVTMIPSGGWHARLEMKDGSTRDTPLVGWCLSENDIAVPFFYPDGSLSATELSLPSISANPEWGITSYRVYHPGDRTQDSSGAVTESSRPLVHLMAFGADGIPEFSEAFTQCCGFNWRWVIGKGLITGNQSLVTCTGRLRTT